ncbi:MAG TPA: 23S rRNA (adenine(2503)-C(2))-methyltransferase RlmN [Actinomycetota bacterium]|nr:23S rRNA (adenine(2503)-C(2))-methyltransferase RlmN [Actinomycetota bacterium]
MTVYDLDLDGLTERLVSWGEPAFRARQVYAQLWRRSATYEEMTDVSARLRERLQAELPLEVELLDERTADRGATRKVLLRMGGRHVIETVLMGYRDRVTACVSSQSGCAMGCSFCATGQMGLLNNLSAGEIAAQVVWARRAASHLPASTPQRITNVVFMGMGEPFANERPVLGALARLTDPRGMRLGSRHVTISTVGVVPGIRRLPDANDQVRLAVSLHAADDELRNELVPVNRLWPLDTLVEAIAGWRERTHHRPSIEWAMIDGVNDSVDQARKLAPIAFGLHAHVNLIPLNPTPGSPSRPSPPARIRAFVDVLERARVNVTVRDTRGRGIEAACGQLRWEHDRAPAAV